MFGAIKLLYLFTILLALANCEYCPENCTCKKMLTNDVGIRVVCLGTTEKITNIKNLELNEIASEIVHL